MWEIVQDELQWPRCETVQGPEIERKSAVGSRYQMTAKGITDSDEILHIAVKCKSLVRTDVDELWTVVPCLYSSSYLTVVGGFLSASCSGRFVYWSC